MNEEFQLTIASLLHDIGKLGYRAGSTGSHEEIGKNLVQKYENILPKVSSLISLHHQRGVKDLFNQDGYPLLKKIIIADWLASSERIGIERAEDVKGIGLSPIFSKVSIFNQKEPQKYCYLGKELSLKEKSEEIFPQIQENASPLLNTFKRVVYNWRGSVSIRKICGIG